MRRAGLVLLLFLTLNGEVAAAGSVGEFTHDEQTVIARNSALRDLLSHNPQLVRQIMDAMSAARAAGSGARSGPLPPETPPDPDRNPDLYEFGRASPEAAHDLFQLIKKATQRPRGR